jgi:hypothetical protein
MSSRAEGVARDRQIALTGIVLAPVLLIAGLAIGMEPATFEGLVPLGHAWIQGGIALLVLVLAPAALSLAWTDAPVARTGTWVARGIAIAIGLGVIAWVMSNVSQIGCQPVTNPMQTVPVGLVWGGVAGLGFLAAVAAGRWYAASARPIAAIAVGAGVGLVSIAADILAFMLLFPPLSCAAPRIPV